MDYIRTLEDQNEELRELLTEAERWKPTWRIRGKQLHYNFYAMLETPVDVVCYVRQPHKSSIFVVEYSKEYFRSFFTNKEAENLCLTQFHSFLDVQIHLKEVLDVMEKVVRNIRHHESRSL